MLTRLHIENYALIEKATIEFGSGFNVLTGETGSGKSIIVDALGLILGERAESGVVRSGAKIATVTGEFPSPFATPAAAAAWAETNGLSELDSDLHLRRELAANGRSRAFLDQQMVTLAVLRQLARRLGEIHSQHESLVSFTPAAQLQLLDRFASCARESAATAAAYAEWSACDTRARALQTEERLRLQQADLWRFQADEIDAVRPLPGEDSQLAPERLRLAHAEKIAAAASLAYDALYDSPQAALAQLKLAARQAQELARFDQAATPLLQRLEGLRVETADIADQIRSLADRTESGPARLAQIEERLAALERLCRKYGPTLDDVLRHRQQLAAKLDQVENAERYQTEATIATAAAADKFRRAATALGEKRRAAAARLRKKLEAEVADLAMTLRFEAEFESGDVAWSPTGTDHIRFLASTNPGEPMAPVAEIASGGELSRLLLALHIVAPAEPGAEKTLVLDEVDAGIGGHAAAAVGRKLQRLGEHYQVLAVTHLPQIASFASHHLQVEKSQSGARTVTQVRTLSPSERVAEIARMLAGNKTDATSLRHARELLAAHAATPA
ncbi:MAG TPA: DNA repair protein RecN [Terriglobales bacterium]|nr:DNA repair protein RecN [Terriglobales bacterium]